MIFIWLDKETGDCIETQTFRQGLLMGGLNKSLLSTIRLKEGEYYYKNMQNGNCCVNDFPNSSELTVNEIKGPKFK